MNKDPSQADYDEAYFRSHFGRLNCDRSDSHWSRFFGKIAEHIANDLRPKTVLDAGCAQGFLVEGLRKFQIEAFGRHYSEFGVRDLPQTLQAFCDVGSIDEPLTGTFDLIVCVEVLQHMPEEDRITTISSLCKASDTILFSSRPDVSTEPTPLIVRPLLYWLKLFQQQGFGPRSDYDASYVCTWAMVLERRVTVITDEELRAYANLVLLRMEHSRLVNQSPNEPVSGLTLAHGDGERRLDEARAEHESPLLGASARMGIVNQEINELNEKAVVLAQQLARQHEALELMRRSTSWRLTAPYRKIGQQLRRVIHIARVLPKIAKIRGGYIPLFGSVWRVFSTEGVRGAIQLWKRANDGTIAAITGSGVGLPSSNYTAWLHAYANLDDKIREEINRQISRWQDPPLISIVMPVYNPDLGWLEEAIASVRGQLYANWELCIADDCSTVGGVKEFLQRQSEEDKRIKTTYRPVNGHISDASNSALELATGQWMSLLDQDDLLMEDALYYVARAIVDNRDLDLIYSDEDKIERGGRFDPTFKPDWNVELLRSHNMACHLSTFRTDRVRAIGAFRKGFEGAQDYDLVLRFSEGLSVDRIRHIPRVLYHWRAHSNSTAQGSGNKSYAAVAGQKALAQHLERLGVEAEVEVLQTGMYRTHYSLPQRPPLVSLIIPTRNGLDLLRQCVNSILRKTSYPAYEIIIIDNNSDDPATLTYFGEIATNPRVRVERDERPFNYSALNNRAVEISNGDYIGLINNDIEVISPNWLSEMMGLALQDGVGAVGARLWYPDDTLQHGGVIIGLGGVAGHSHKRLKRGLPGYCRRAELPQDLSAITAACLVIKRATFVEVGGLNDVDLKIAFNDVDFCLKVQEAGYRNVWTPYAELYHHESASRGLEDTPEKVERFRQEISYMHARWQTHLRLDPAYNPNLSIAYEDFSLAWPPRNEGDPSFAS